MPPDREWKGEVQPGGAGRWGEPTSFEESTRRQLELRAEWAARPEEVEKALADALATERIRLAELAAKGMEGGLHGPPDARKGRAPMTK